MDAMPPLRATPSKRFPRRPRVAASLIFPSAGQPIVPPPPSAKLVAKVLELDAPLSQGQLADESLLPDRTVRYALNRLEEVGLVASRYSFHDARKQVYFLTN
jgi:DNA-binding transcriptional ArsR family regulator